jgi:hypothetical protein
MSSIEVDYHVNTLPPVAQTDSGTDAEEHNTLSQDAEGWSQELQNAVELFFAF